jgi:hypothetical protein
MKKNQKFVVSLLSLCVLVINAKAQVYTALTSSQDVLQRFGISETSEIPNVTFNALSLQDLQSLYIEDSIGGAQNKPYRFAKLLSTDLTPENNGVWYATETSIIWTFEIRATRAKSLSLTFQEFAIPEGAELFLISGAKDLLYGPITSVNFPQDAQEMATEVLSTDKLIVYYSEPKNISGLRNIRIKEIGYGYRDGGGSSLSCNLDVTANEGDCFRIEQRAVAKLLTNNSTALCTGTLLNNTNSDNNLRPFVLTANHCTGTPTGTSINLNTVGVRFRDWSGNSQGWITFVGVQQRAATGTISDCSLLELNQTTAASQNLFFLGWSRNTAPPANSTVLHHPNGDVMKISHDDQASITNPTTLAFGAFQLSPSRAWRFNPGQTGDFGVLEAGSSGSAMLNPEHRVVGQLKGGERYSCEDKDGDNWFGRFDVSWGTGTTAATRLRDWLDPTNTNVQQENAAYRLSGSAVIPCPGLEQDIKAPFLEMNGGQDYIYTWHTSPNLTIIGTGASVRYKDTGNCTGCNGWIKCDISTPAECNNQLIATSVRRDITWVNPSPATNFRHTIFPLTKNNGSIVGSFNNICVNENYTITAGFQGIPIPSNTIFQWTVNGNGPNIITPVYTSNGWVFVFHTNNPGIFSLTVTVGTGTGCLQGKTETYVFQVLSPCSSGDPKLFVDNGNNGALIASLQASPNPANAFTVIQLPNEWELEETKIQIVDMFGREIRQIEVNGHFLNLDVSSFVSGIYSIQIINNSAKQSVKLIINH